VRALRKGIWQVLVLDVILLVFAYFVQEDLTWRNDYATSHGATVSTSYSLFTRTFQMVRNETTLRSPPTLDWLQVVIAVLIIANVAFLFGGRQTKPRPAPAMGSVQTVQ
jgi:hypothetical protein